MVSNNCHAGHVEYWNEEDSEIEQNISFITCADEPLTPTHSEGTVDDSLTPGEQSVWSGGWWLLLACFKLCTTCPLEQLHGCSDFLVPFYLVWGITQ